MRLRDVKFNSLPVKGLSIFKDGREVASGFIGEVLNQDKIIDLSDYEIKETNYYFDMFVIRL